MVIDGAMDGAAFSAYAESFLAPSLAEGDVVVLDNLAAHKVKGVREAIDKSGTTLLYLPPYSPDFNPIEQAFAKLKALLRKAAARTVEGLESAIAEALEAFSPEECANYFTHAGYKQLDPKMLYRRRQGRRKDAGCGVVRMTIGSFMFCLLLRYSRTTQEWVGGEVCLTAG